MAKEFTQTLREVRDGDLVAELTDKMRQLVEAVRGTDRGGSITVKLTLKPMKKGIGMYTVEDEVKLASPEPERESTTFMFVTADNELTRRDPRQPELPGVRGVVTTMPSPAERAENSNG